MGLLRISVLRPGVGPRAPPGPGLTPCGSLLKEQNHQQHRRRDLRPQRGLKQQRLDGDIKTFRGEGVITFSSGAFYNCAVFNDIWSVCTLWLTLGPLNKPFKCWFISSVLLLMILTSRMIKSEKFFCLFSYFFLSKTCDEFWKCSIKLCNCLRKCKSRNIIQSYIMSEKVRT